MTEQTKLIPIHVSWAVGRELDRVEILCKVPGLTATGVDARGCWYHGTPAALDWVRRKLWEIVGSMEVHGATRNACRRLIDKISTRIGNPQSVGMPRPSVSFESYHYIDKGDDLPREKSPRQDVTFSVIGDSMIVVLPPPAACILYLVCTPKRVLEELTRTFGGNR